MFANLTAGITARHKDAGCDPTWASVLVRTHLEVIVTFQKKKSQLPLPTHPFVSSSLRHSKRVLLELVNLNQKTPSLAR